MAEKRTIDKVTTPRFRVSFPSVFKAEAFQNDDGSMGEPKFSLIAVFEPAKFTAEDKKAWREMQRIEQACMKARFAGKKPAKYKDPFRDGEEKAELDGFGEGKVFVTLSTKQKPGVINRAKERIEGEEDFYAGCYARATVSCYSFDKRGNKGVGFGLHNVQKLANGAPFSSRTDAEEDFDEVEGEEEEVQEDEGKSSSAAKKKATKKVEDDDDFG